MSIGASQAWTLHLQRVKALADRIEPLWVSTIVLTARPGSVMLYDLYPLPVHRRVKAHVIAQIRHAQDAGRAGWCWRMCRATSATAAHHVSEWQFLAHIAEEADCSAAGGCEQHLREQREPWLRPADLPARLPAHRVQ